MKHLHLLTLLSISTLLVFSSGLRAQEWNINSGGDVYTDTSGTTFEADLAYTAGGYGYTGATTNTRSYTESINGTDDDTLYQSIRFSSDPWGYTFDNLPSSAYRIILHFMEPTLPTGGRLTDITVEGVLKIDNLDVFAITGDYFTAHTETLLVAVVDGQLNITIDNQATSPSLLCAISVMQDSTTVVPTTFVNVGAAVGIANDHVIDNSLCAPPLGSGSAWADYDGDGDLDVYFTNHGGPNWLYQNQGDTGGDGLPDFIDVALSAGVDDPDNAGHGCTFIDYDNDGDQDLYVTNLYGNIMFQNQLIESGTATFLDVTSMTGLMDGGRAVTAAWADFNKDGLLDVYLAKHLECMPSPANNEDHLYANNGDGTFSDVTGSLCPGGVAPCAQINGLGFAPGFFDYDDDGDLDLYLVNDILDGTWYHNVLWRNDGPDSTGQWVFTDVSIEAGANQAVNGMGLGVGDFNNDGWLDVAFSNVGPNTLLKNLGDGTFEDISASAGVVRDSVAGGLPSTTWGTCFFDYDNDGFMDLFYVAGMIGGTPGDQPNAFFRNNGDETFSDYSVSSGLNDPGRGRSASMADIDGDGYVDILVGIYGGTPLMYKNNAALEAGESNHWLTITVEGTTSNRDGIGAVIRAITPDVVTRTRLVSSGPTHGGGDHRAAYFGLGTQTTAQIIIEWPTGQVEDFGFISADQQIHLVENSSAPKLYSNVSEAVGITATHVLDETCPMPPIGSGSAWADYDNDGDQDIFITNHGGANWLYQNQGDTNGDGLPDFIDVADVAGVNDPDRVSAGCVFVDFDNDGDQDLYVTHWNGNSLYQNVLMEVGIASFIDVTAIAGVGDADRAITASWGDYDADGYLDLYLAKHFDCMPDIRDTQDKLFHNNGNGTFTDVSGYLCPGGALPCPQMDEGHGFTGGWVDYDNDGDLDLYLVNDVVAFGYHNILWRNDGADSLGGWTFTDVSTESGTDFGINGMGLGVGDYNNDGWMDVAFSHTNGGFMLKNNGDGTFADVTDSAGVRANVTPLGDTRITWGTVFFDHDNDSWLDLYYVAGRITPDPILQPNAFFRNNADGTFTDWSDTTGINDASGRGRSASIADFDDDGFVDLFVGNFGGQLILYRNDSPDKGNTNHWLTVTAEGKTSNRDGIGTRFWLETADGVTRMRDITSGPTHGGGDQKAAFFGLGSHTTATLTVRWPDGTIEDLGEVTADQHLHVIEGGTVSVDGDDGQIQKFALHQNYPNPFNPSTTIKYALKNETHVTLKIYNVIGQEVATLVDEVQTAGARQVVWNGKNNYGAQVATGMYIYRMTAGDFVQSHKMILTK